MEALNSLELFIQFTYVVSGGLFIYGLKLLVMCSVDLPLRTKHFAIDCFSLPGQMTSFIFRLYPRLRYGNLRKP